MRGSRKFRGGILTTFLCLVKIIRISKRVVRISFKNQLDPRGPIESREGSVPEFLRKIITTCDFQRGGRGSLAPPPPPIPSDTAHAGNATLVNDRPTDDTIRTRHQDTGRQKMHIKRNTISPVCWWCWCWCCVRDDQASRL